LNDNQIAGAKIALTRLQESLVSEIDAGGNRPAMTADTTERDHRLADLAARLVNVAQAIQVLNTM